MRKNNIIAILLIVVLMVSMLTACSKPQEKVKCTLSITCHTLVTNKENASESALKVLPDDGVILKETEVEINKGESVYDALKKVCKDKKIILDTQETPGSGSYTKGIANISEQDCGNLSGWMFKINGKLSDKGASLVTVSDKDVIEWQYTCEMGEDLK